MRAAALARRRDLAAREGDAAGGGALTGTKTRAVIASLRMPARDIVQRMNEGQAVVADESPVGPGVGAHVSAVYLLSRVDTRPHWPSSKRSCR
jgi:hypothetical protein